MAKCHICSHWDCERAHTGPYKLLRGGWSDGVDRKHRVNRLLFNRANPSRWSVSKCGDEWEVFQDDAGYEYPPDAFDTHAEAIAYADRAARTTKNGANK